ncbi:MAG: TolC family protein, partial [Bacteroidales bacterium]|nr:TolC family protein [Bacteroidales bacterium]
IQLGKAQDTTSFSLSQVLDMASQNSLETFRAKNMYLASYWEHKSFLASQLPSLDLNLTPVEFRRMMTKRYDFEQNIDIFREQKTMENYARLSVTQSIPGLGGQVYVDTDLSRLVNYGDSDITTFSATWLRIGVSQPIFGFNQLKWEKRISPIKFDIAKKAYLQSQQQTKLKAVQLYFDLLLAGNRKEIAYSNYATSDTLFKIGSKKIEILAIDREELLDLELNKFNAEIEIVKAEQDEEKAMFNLNSFLGFDAQVIIKTNIPEISDNVEIKAEQAVELAKNNNPAILDLEQKKLEVDKLLDKAVKESRFNANLTASFGLNQYSDKLPQAYQNPLDQQVVVFGLQIPILDWGERKGKKQMARKNQEVTYIETKQTLSDFEQAVVLKVLDFNLQPRIVESSRKADKIADMSFNMTKIRFMLGKADILKMNNAMKARQSSREMYINSIFTYWKYYYELQGLTLYNLKTGKDLAEDFEKLIETE